jgi:hypothetical protein
MTNPIERFLIRLFGKDRVMTRDRMRQSLKGRALSRAFSSSSAGEDFWFKCLFKSIAKAQKDRKRWISSEMIKYMGLLPADFSFHYVMNFVNEDNDCIGLGSGESSGSSSLPTTWWEVWELFSKTKCPKAPPLVDSACPNPMQILLNCINFLQRPKIYCDIFAEGFENRVRIIMKFTEGAGCQFWWAMRPLKDDTRETTFHVISNYQLFCQRGCLVDADFTFSQFDHSEILSSLNQIIIKDPLLIKALNIESLVTDQPWTDSMLDIAKFAICFANILMTGAAKPQALTNFSERGIQNEMQKLVL